MSIIGRLFFYGGLGFILGLGVGYHVGKVSVKLKKPIEVSQLEKIAERNVITDPRDHKRYRINFDTLRLEPYPTEQTHVAPPIYQEKNQEDLRELFE